jgi:hypothetical protein
MKNYYKIIDGKLQTTNSSIELELPWIEYALGEEPEELKAALKYQEDEADIIRNICESLEYLKSTDFYYVRKAETGEEVPDNVVEKRIKARSFLKSNNY